MKRGILLFMLFLMYLNGNGQNLGIKSNLLYDATSTINLGIEYAISDKLTLDVSMNFNPWAFPQQRISRESGEVIFQHDAILKNLMIQPEMRWWLCEKFNGHFFGAHIHGGYFNVGGLTCLPERFGDGWIDENGRYNKGGFQHNRFEGWFAGVGGSYGYHWILSNRMSMEFSLGAGYAYMRYDKYRNYSSVENPPKESTKFRLNYFGLTKAGISLIYMLY